MWSDREGYQDEVEDVCPYCGGVGEMAFRDFIDIFPGVVDDLVNHWGITPKPHDSVPCAGCEETL